MKRTVLFLTLLCGAAVARAEPSRLGLSLAWFGEQLLHPGVRVGVEYELVSAEGHALVVGGGLGGYAHRGHATGLFATVDLGYRHTFTRGFLLEAFGHLGWLQAFLAGATVTPGAGGGFEPVPAASNAALLAGGTVGLGWDWSRQHPAPLAFTFRFTALEQWPVNTVSQLHLVAQLALTWKF